MQGRRDYENAHVEFFIGMTDEASEKWTGLETFLRTFGKVHRNEKI